MKLLVTGKGTSGSWEIRGRQLGAAMNATVQPMWLDPKGFDRIIMVKRPAAPLLEWMAKRKCPLIWDVVDSWPQPVGNHWNRDQCMEWMRDQLKRIQPDGIIAATDSMRQDLLELTKVPVIWVPHHARPDYREPVIRDEVAVIGYEGGTNYLEGYIGTILDECAKRDWVFLINPMNYHAMDVVLAVRGVAGYAPKHWKSNVKLANAQANGIPIICNPEMGYRETCTGDEVWCYSPSDLPKLFDYIKPRNVRRLFSQGLRENIITVDAMAEKVTEWLRYSF
jgi:hypothetical protein